MAPLRRRLVNTPYPSQLPCAVKDGKQAVMTGAERAEARAKDGAVANHADWIGPGEPEPPAEVELTLPEEPAARPRGTGPRLFGAFLILVALGWIGAVGWLFLERRAAAAAPE